MAAPSTSPAARQIFDIAEILEIILLNVENKTLLLSQRVDKTFAAAVQTSHRIQQKLFFSLPAKKSTDIIVPDYATFYHLATFNPLLLNIELVFGTPGYCLRLSFSRSMQHRITSLTFTYCICSFNRTQQPTGHESWQRMLLGDVVGCTEIVYRCAYCATYRDQALSPQDAHGNVTLDQIARYLVTHRDPYRSHGCQSTYKGMTATGYITTKRIESDQ